MKEITRIDDGKKGRFEITVDGKHAGEMTYVWAGTDKFIIDHTEVDEQYNGLGLGQDLVTAAVEFARKEGKKIKPLCPFAHAMFKRHIEFQDVLG